MSAFVDASMRMADVRHVYVHPSKEASVREQMRMHGIEATAELHVDPECPPERAYWCVEPLEEMRP